MGVYLRQNDREEERYLLSDIANNSDDIEDDENDERLEEMRRKLAQNRRRTKLDLSAGLTDLKGDGKVDNLVVQFLEKLKMSHAETKRNKSSNDERAGSGAE